MPDDFDTKLDALFQEHQKQQAQTAAMVQHNQEEKHARLTEFRQLVDNPIRSRLQKAADRLRDAGHTPTVEHFDESEPTNPRIVLTVPTAKSSITFKPGTSPRALTVEVTINGQEPPTTPSDILKRAGTQPPLAQRIDEDILAFTQRVLAITPNTKV